MPSFLSFLRKSINISESFTTIPIRANSPITDKKITSHVIGSIGYIDKKDLLNLDKKKYRNTEYIGKTGIEKFYEDTLYGVPGYRHVEINAKGRELRDIEKKPAFPGDDIYLTIDINLQKYMYSLLSGYVGSSIAMNPKNGEILGMISTPAIDPN